MPRLVARARGCRLAALVVVALTWPPTAAVGAGACGPQEASAPTREEREARQYEMEH